MSSWTAGAPGASVWAEASGSYSTSISSRASSAAYRLSATTAATASPTNRARSPASREKLRPRSSGVRRHHGERPRRRGRDRRSVTTSTTPGCARARAASTRRMRAWACGLRRSTDVEHAGQGDVAHVAPAPGEQARVLLAQMPVADELHARMLPPRAGPPRRRARPARCSGSPCSGRGSRTAPRGCPSRTARGARADRRRASSGCRACRIRTAARGGSGRPPAAGAAPVAVARQALDGVHPAAVGLHGEDEAGARGLAVHQHGAGPAGAVLAAEVRAREAEVLAQQIREEHARDHARPALGAVHGQPRCRAAMQPGDVTPPPPARPRWPSARDGRAPPRRGAGTRRWRAGRRARSISPARRPPHLGRAAPPPAARRSAPRRRAPACGASPAAEDHEPRVAADARRVERERPRTRRRARSPRAAAPPRRSRDRCAARRRPGTSISASSSSGSSAVASRPRKKSSARHARAARALRRCKTASSAIMQAGSSAAGSAWTRLPPIGARAPASADAR